jgi:hypothetical protein
MGEYDTSAMYKARASRQLSRSNQKENFLISIEHLFYSVKFRESSDNWYCFVRQPLISQAIVSYLPDGDTGSLSVASITTLLVVMNFEFYLYCNVFGVGTSMVTL